jgi:outer membrane receptor protein involved in Fe transport
VGNHPFSYETNATVQGGTETTQYFASVLANHTGGIITNTYADKRSLRLNLDQAAGSRLKFSIGSEVMNTGNDQGLTINENNNSSLYASLANTPNFFDMRPGPDGTFTNPYVASNALQTAALMKNREYVWRFIGTGHATLDAISTQKNTLRFLVNGGADFFNQSNEVFSPPELLFEPLDGLLGTSVVSNSNNLNFNVNANVVHIFNTNSMSFTTQFGTQYESRELKINRILAANLVGGLQNVTSGTTTGIDAQHQYVKDFGMFAQEEWLSLRQRLLLTVGIRADQSSNNGDPSKLFYYPKAAASYRIPNVIKGVVDELKIRAAFGESGNQPLYGQKFTALTGLNVGGVPGALIQTSAAAPNIIPERQAELEGGFDANMFGGRANLVATVYQKRITDLLLARALPSSLGFTQQFLNGGIMNTRGLELSLDGAPIQTHSFRWNGRVAFSLFRSNIDSLPVPQFGGCGFGGGSVRIAQGGSATAVWGPDTLADGSTQCLKLGETRPDYTVQFGSDFKYKALGFSFTLDRSKGGLISDLTAWLYDLDGQSPDFDAPAPNGGKLGDYRAQTFNRTARVYVQDASYLKLREATFTLDLPNSFVRGIWGAIRFARLSASARNLFSWHSYKGSDPEARWVAENSLSQALPQELWAYPPSRTFWFSLDLGF